MSKIKVYNKLVRDKIPEVIENTGKHFDIHIATGEEYQKHLHEKLKEEVEEFIAEPCIEELADILEVIDSIKEFYKFNDGEIAKVKSEKFEKRGGFSKGIILEKVYEK